MRVRTYCRRPAGRACVSTAPHPTGEGVVGTLRARLMGPCAATGDLRRGRQLYDRPRPRLPSAADVPEEGEELDRSNSFGPVRSPLGMGARLHHGCIPGPAAHLFGPPGGGA